MLLNRPITAIILILAAFIFGSLTLNKLSVDQNLMIFESAWPLL